MKSRVLRSDGQLVKIGNVGFETLEIGEEGRRRSRGMRCEERAMWA